VLFSFRMKNKGRVRGTESSILNNQFQVIRVPEKKKTSHVENQTEDVTEMSFHQPENPQTDAAKDVPVKDVP